MEQIGIFRLSSPPSVLTRIASIKPKVIPVADIKDRGSDILGQRHKFHRCQIPLSREILLSFIVSLFAPFSWVLLVCFHLSVLQFLSLLLSFDWWKAGRSGGGGGGGIPFQSGSGRTNRWWTNQRRRIDQLVAGPPIKRHRREASFDLNTTFTPIHRTSC